MKLLRDVFLTLYKPHQVMEVALQLLTIDTALCFFLKIRWSLEEVCLNIAYVQHVLHEVRRQADVVSCEGLFLPPGVAENHFCLIYDVLAVWLLGLVKTED